MRLKDFKEMINRTIFCASSGIISPPSAHWKDGKVLLEKISGNLIIAVLNNYNNSRLGFFSRNVGDDFPDFDKIVVPPQVLQKVTGRKQDTAPLSISISGKVVNFNIGSASITTTTFSEEFIKFIRNADEFPKKYPLSFTVDRVLLLESLGQVSIATEIWKPAVNIELSSGTLALHTGDDDCSANTEIPCDYSGENMVLAFHVKYFTEIIEHICTERVTIIFDVKKETVVILPMPEQNCFYFLAQRKRW
jgi:DNA polymerase III sliding clamp (beta) subunit (PCNA family)